MIIVTHEMAFAREVADHVIFMADGHIIEQGTPTELFDETKNERTKRFIQKKRRLKKHKSLFYSLEGEYQ
ncbi:hypothetical protein ACEQPO_02790 [Bacillus sp. SL00103]